MEYASMQFRQSQVRVEGSNLLFINTFFSHSGMKNPTGTYPRGQMSGWTGWIQSHSHKTDNQINHQINNQIKQINHPTPHLYSRGRNRGNVKETTEAHANSTNTWQRREWWPLSRCAQLYTQTQLLLLHSAHWAARYLQRDQIVRAIFCLVPCDIQGP